MRELELQEFVDEIYADFKNNEDTEYIFFLGAGCSKSSGIPLASELAKAWYEELKKQIIKFDKFNKKHKISNSQGLDYGKFYFQIFEELFPTPLMQQKEIQRITNDDKVNPSLGYYVLASLMQLSSFNTIVTTNFDNLIQDALIYSGNKRALVITHQDLAKFIKRDNTPLITKIHGDAHLHPFNNISSTKTIPDELKGAIQGLFTNAKVICIGYGGNDESIADFLNGCNRIDQVYWLNFSEPKDVKLSNWWDKLSTKTYINEYDFDKIMSIIKSKFDIKSPNFERRAKVLQDRYESAIQEEIEDIEQMKDKTYLDYFILGNTYDNQKEYIKAIQAYQKAIKLNPKYSDAYYNLGIVYGKEDEYDKAIEVYQRAIELNPKNDKAYNNIGVIYKNKEEYDKAIEAHQKAIELNPKNDKAIINIGNIYYIKEECDKAIEVYQESKEQYNQLFKKISKQEKLVSNQLTIPGIGEISAVKIVSTVVDAGRFKKAGHYLVYCGLVKHEKLSGGKVYGKRKPRYNRAMKAVYKTAAMAAIRSDSPIREYYEYLLSKGVSEHNARNAAARYIAKISYGMLKNGEKYEPYRWRKTNRKQKEEKQ